MRTEKKIRVVIFDDKNLRLDGIRCLLDSESEIEIADACEKPDDLPAHLKATKPDVLLVLGRHYSEALEATKGLTIKVVVLTSLNNIFIEQMMSGGVKAVALDTSGRRELLSALRCAARNEKYLDPGVAENLGEFPGLRKLSAREVEIFHYISQGHENLDIAHKTHISERTVKNHVSHILKKLELQNRTQIAVFAWSKGLAKIEPTILYSMLRLRRSRAKK